jgi:hypothetical protein
MLSNWSKLAAPDLRFRIVIKMIPIFAYHSDGSVELPNK